MAITGLTQEESRIMSQRDELLTETEREFVDATFEDIFANSRIHGVPISGDDRSAKLEAALIRCIIESRK